MNILKKYKQTNVYEEAKKRIEFAFDNSERVYVSFSGGKDSTVCLYMGINEARKRNRKLGVMFIDLEAQYSKTIEHVKNVFSNNLDILDIYWICLPLSLRNAVSNFQPKWVCWDCDSRDKWVRGYPETLINLITENQYFNFFKYGMEFEQFMLEFGEWYSNGMSTINIVGIRADESLNRYRTIFSNKKEKLNKACYSARASNNVHNIYPIYDWKTSDIWKYHSVTKTKYNSIYDLMFMAGVKLGNMRLCQPYGDDQKRGLYLYHILEPDTWSKIYNRVSGVNGGSLYINEHSNINGSKIEKPQNHTWKSFCNILLKTMPEETSRNYHVKFNQFIKKWNKMAYSVIPNSVPIVLENKILAPSYRMLCKVLLKNDWYCKGLGFSQPKTTTYGEYLKIRKPKKKKIKNISNLIQDELF